MDKLLEYQKSHTENIINSLVIYSRALDASDTGTGKTFTSVCACKTIGWIPFVICPKSVISAWVKVFEYFKCDYYGITNYELMQNCTYYNSNGEKTKLTFLTRDVVKKDPLNDPLGLDLNSSSDSESDDEVKYEYKWLRDKIPDNMLFIFDEAHRCKNAKTNNGQILHNLASISNVKILILSATVVDKPKYFVLIGYVLGLYDSVRKGRYWIKKVSSNFSHPMKGVHIKIYPEYASRMKVSKVKNEFPKCKIIAESRKMDNAVQIQEAWDEIKQATDELKAHEIKASPLPKIIYARQRIELLKLPEFIKLAKEEINKGNSVVIFVNFTDTLLMLGEKLNTTCLIYGEQKIDDRNKNIEDFQNDKYRICICNIKAGGTGISLNDTHGIFPRVAIISPTWSAQDLIQVLGRIFRAKTKSDVVQKIIFCAGTVEDDVCEMIKDKISNIAYVNDGSMDSYIFEGLTDDKVLPKSICSNIGSKKSDIELNLNTSSTSSTSSTSNTFIKVFDSVSKLYDRKLSLQKELDIINKEITNSETLLNHMYNH